MKNPGEKSIHPLEGHTRVIVLEDLLEGGALQGHAIGSGLAHAQTVSPTPAVEDPAALGPLAHGEPPEDVVLQAKQPPDVHAAHPMRGAQGIDEGEIKHPALAADWHEPPLALNALGLPEDVLSLAGLRQTFAEAVAGLRREHQGPVGAKVAETFEWLPLRAVAFHDDAQLPLDFEGTGPCGHVSLWIGIHRDRAVVLEGRSPATSLPRRWSVEGLGDRLPAEAFLLAAGLDPEPPKGFEAALQSALNRLCHWMEGPLEAYRRTYPVGISWHHGRRERLLGRTIVDVDGGSPPMLILDDGTEVAIDPDSVLTKEHGGI